MPAAGIIVDERQSEVYFDNIGPYLIVRVGENAEHRINVRAIDSRGQLASTIPTYGTIPDVSPNLIWQHETAYSSSKFYTHELPAFSAYVMNGSQVVGVTTRLYMNNKDLCYVPFHVWRYVTPETMVVNPRLKQQVKWSDYVSGGLMAVATDSEDGFDTVFWHTNQSIASALGLSRGKVVSVRKGTAVYAFGPTFESKTPVYGETKDAYRTARSAGQIHQLQQFPYIMYSNSTEPSWSGGPIVDYQNHIVAFHLQGGTSNGLNRGIPVQLLSRVCFPDGFTPEASPDSGEFQYSEVRSPDEISDYDYDDEYAAYEDQDDVRGRKASWHEPNPKQKRRRDRDPSDLHVHSRGMLVEDRSGLVVTNVGSRQVLSSTLQYYVGAMGQILAEAEPFYDSGWTHDMQRDLDLAKENPGRFMRENDNANAYLRFENLINHVRRSVQTQKRRLGLLEDQKQDVEQKEHIPPGEIYKRLQLEELNRERENREIEEYKQESRQTEQEDVVPDPTETKDESVPIVSAVIAKEPVTTMVEMNTNETVFTKWRRESGISDDVDKLTSTQMNEILAKEFTADDETDVAFMEKLIKRMTEDVERLKKIREMRTQVASKLDEVRQQWESLQRRDNQLVDQQRRTKEEITKTQAQIQTKKKKRKPKTKVSEVVAPVPETQESEEKKESPATAPVLVLNEPVKFQPESGIVAKILVRNKYDPLSGNEEGPKDHGPIFNQATDPTQLVCDITVPSNLKLIPESSMEIYKGLNIKGRLYAIMGVARNCVRQLPDLQKSSPELIDTLGLLLDQMLRCKVSAIKCTDAKQFLQNPNVTNYGLMKDALISLLTGMVSEGEWISTTQNLVKECVLN